MTKNKNNNISNIKKIHSRNSFSNTEKTELSNKSKRQIELGVKKAIKEYGDVFKKLGKE